MASMQQLEPALSTLVRLAFAFEHAVTAHDQLPFIFEALRKRELTSVEAVLASASSFRAGEIACTQLDALAAELRSLWPPEAACKWWPEPTPDDSVRECWRMFILAARQVCGTGDPPGEQDWTELGAIGLRRADEAIHPISWRGRGLFCDLPGDECLIVYQKLNTAALRLRAIVAAEVVALAEDLRRNGDKRCYLNHAWLGGAELAGANLFKANLRGINGTSANFAGAMLAEATLTKAFCGFACFKGASMKFATAHHVSFSFASLQGSNLTRAEFAGVENNVQYKVNRK